MRRSLFLLLFLAAPALAAQGAPAGGARPGAQAAAQPLVITAENRTAALEAARGRKRADERVLGGDVLRYTLAFTNRQADRVRNVVLSNPIPAELRYVAGSARTTRPDVRLEFSADKGRTWSAQPMETVVENGRSIRRPVAPERYTDVRWVVTGFVEPRATFTAEYEARLPVAPAPATPAAPAPQRDGGR